MLDNEILIQAMCQNYTKEELASMCIEAEQIVHNLRADLLVMRNENKAFSMMNTELTLIINDLTKKH